MGNYSGRHRATRSTVTDRVKARGRALRPAFPTAGITGIAVAGSVLLSATPVMTTAPELLAQAFYLRGTNIGTVPPDDAYAAFADSVIEQTAGDHDAAQKVPYPGGFWPISKGYFADPTYDASVAQGLASLTELAGDQTGAVIYGYSQGAVVATEYKRETGAVGNTYVLVANPNRPNGGILQRFNGVSVPILDITFNGATPTDGDITYDIARQYDGWVDFPKYPLNLLATANAVLGILYLHGKYEQDIDPADLDDPTKTDKSVYNNTTYYLIHTDRLPLLMPLNGILPDAFLDALDPPLRALVELGYDRTNYGEPATAGLFPPANPHNAPPIAAAAQPESPSAAEQTTPKESTPGPTPAAPGPADGEVGKPGAATPDPAPRPARKPHKFPREVHPSSAAVAGGTDTGDSGTGDAQEKPKSEPKPGRTHRSDLKAGNRDASRHPGRDRSQSDAKPRSQSDSKP